MKIIELANKIAAEKHQTEINSDSSFGVEIPAATVTFLKRNIVKTYNLMLRGTFGQLVELYGPQLPDLASAENMMISLVNAADDLNLRDVAKSALSVLSSMARIRDTLYNNIHQFELAKKVDELMKRVQDHLWKDSKRIFSCPELKGTPLYTWNAGPGSNPTKPVRTFKDKNPMQQLRELEQKPDFSEKKNNQLTFDDYEKMLDGGSQDTVMNEPDLIEV